MTATRNNVLIFAEVSFPDTNALAEYLEDMSGSVRLDKVVVGFDGKVTARVDALLTPADVAGILDVDSATPLNARKYKFGAKTFRANKNGSSVKTTTSVAIVKNS